MTEYDELYFQRSKRQFRQAEAAVDRAVADFVSKLDKIMGQCGGRWDTVAASYVRDRALDAMSDELAKLIDVGPLSNLTGPAHLKLSNALADFHDSSALERYGVWSDGV
jgi:hypothetical protein